MRRVLKYKDINWNKFQEDDLIAVIKRAYHLLDLILSLKLSSTNWSLEPYERKLSCMDLAGGKPARAYLSNSQDSANL
jgi:hypothetical protein